MNIIDIPVFIKIYYKKTTISLFAQILKKYMWLKIQGKTVLVIGGAGTVLPTIKAVLFLNQQN
jgi:hypothetical protein